MSFTRRDLLGLLLGGPLVGAACRRLPRTIPGAIHGASRELGHRLRDATVERAQGPATALDVAIVGGGVSGLGAGWRLKRLGIRALRVFELEPIPGGTSAYSADGVVAHPWAAHYLPQPSRKNRALCALLGETGALEAQGEDQEPRAREDVLVREPEERLFHGHAWYRGLYPRALASPEDLAELDRFQGEIDGWVAWRDGRGRRAFAVPSSQCSDDAEVTSLDHSSAATWLEQRGFRSELLRWYVDYACRDDYGTGLGSTSAWAMMFYFASRVPAPHEPSAPLLTWPEGNGRLVRHLAGVLGPDLEVGRLVTEVVPRADAVELSVFDARAGHLRRFLADYVIMATPRFVTRRLLRPWRERTPAFVSEFSYAPWLVGNLHLRERPTSHGFPFAWDNVLYDSRSLGYVVATHQTRADLGPTVWTWYHAFAGDDAVASRMELEALDHRTITQAILTDLGRAHQGLERALERIEVWRWGHAMIRPTPGFIWGTARRQAIEPLGRVHFAHSDLSGLALFEEALDHGIRAAEAVAVGLGRSLSSLREP